MFNFLSEINGYYPIECCGHGAYGNVWLVKDEAGRQFALKVIDNAELQEKELQGLIASSRIKQCPNLIQIYHIGRYADWLFYTMEAADNAGDSQHYKPDTLALRLAKSPGGLPTGEVQKLALMLLGTLGTLHDSGLVHRDIKPENIIYVNGVPKLSDLGLLRSMSLTVSLGGTLGYIPPDKLAQYSVNPNAGAKADSSDDLYALGKVLYCALTSNSPEKFPSIEPEKLQDRSTRQFYKVLLFACGNRPYPHRFSNAEDFALAIRRGRVPRNKAMTATMLFIAVLALIACAGLAIWHHHSKAKIRQQELTILKENQKDKYKQLNQLLPRLQLQLNSADTARLKRLIAATNQSIQDGDLTSTGNSISQLEAMLTKFAAKYAPSKERLDFKGTADIFGYLESPLGRNFLTENQRDTLSNAANLAAADMAIDASPRLGRDFTENTGIPIQFQFVAPGSFYASIGKGQRKIAYPFWIFQREVTNDQFNYMMRYVSSRNDAKSMPITHMGYYDMLTYCMHLTKFLQERYALPEGYAVRLPTEDEWEYAAQGAWDGQFAKDEPSEIASIYDMKNANHLDIYGMGSNFYEYAIVGSFDEIHEIAMLGNHSSGKPKRKLLKRNFMNIPNATFRPVLAPTPKGFFDKELTRMPDEIYELKIDNRHYTGLVSYGARINFYGAEALAESMGAYLPEPKSIEEWRQLYTKLNIFSAFPAFVGAKWDGSRWCALSDGNPMQLTKVKAPKRKEDSILIGTQTGIKAGNPLTYYPALILEWRNEEAWQQRDVKLRNGQAKNVIRRFTIGERQFTLLKCQICATAVEALCRLAGGNPAILSSQEEREEVIRQLEGIDGPVCIGARRFSNNWRWLDGTQVFKRAIEIPRIENYVTPMFSRALDMLAIHNGKLMALSYTEYILLEFK